MMKNTLTLLFVTLSLVSYSALEYVDTDAKLVYIPYSKKSSEKDKDLVENEALFKFEFRDMSGKMVYNVIYSVDGQESTQELSAGEQLTIKTTPGEHIFQFYIGVNFRELQTDPIFIEPQYCDQYIVTLLSKSPIMDNRVCKPVIYLYPKKDTEVTVKVDIHGKDPFFYPEYKNEWKCKAQPTGDLIIGDNTYNYLFWESTASNSYNLPASKSGFFVKGENVISFLEGKLDQAGLTSKEKADFITYWGPKLAVEKLSFVHFIFNEECDRYADLTISPKPDNLYRLYIIWSSVNQQFRVKEQEIKKINRNGFTAFEWGGQLFPLKKTPRMITTNEFVE